MKSSSTSCHNVASVSDAAAAIAREVQQIRSIDAGLTWEEMHIGWKLADLGFSPDGSDGLTVGDGGEMQYTSDGEMSWIKR